MSSFLAVRVSTERSQHSARFYRRVAELGTRAAEALADWKTVYEKTYSAAGAAPSFVGWNSSYDGRPIPQEQMQEWLQGTVQRLRALKPRRVLEIGCGVGLILQQLAPECEEYRGTDISDEALQRLRSWLSTRPELQHVQLETCAAAEAAVSQAGHYDTVIQAVAKLSYYVPLLISTGGNSGSQSASLIIRGLAVGEVKLSDWWRIAGRELAQGVVLGLILAAVGVVRVTMWGDGPRFALLIGSTLISIVVMGCVVGSMLPLALRRAGFDPATSSTPFIASLVDVLGIIIYFNIAQLLLSEVIQSAVTSHHP